VPPRRRHRNQQGGAAPVGIRGARPGFAATAAPAAGARLLVDGRNVQRALERGSAPGSLPTASLIALLRAAFPDTELELVLDGHARGSPTGRIAPGFSVAYSRHATADQVIGDRVVEALRQLGPAGAWSVTVVSDDREVRDHALRNGARVESTAWLAERVAALGRRGTGIGHGKAPRRARSTSPGARVE
jgi:predicted RNA-binding protein with PIN domain